MLLCSCNITQSTFVCFPQFSMPNIFFLNAHRLLCHSLSRTGVALDIISSAAIHHINPRSFHLAKNPHISIWCTGAYHTAFVISKKTLFSFWCMETNTFGMAEVDFFILGDDECGEKPSAASSESFTLSSFSAPALLHWSGSKCASVYTTSAEKHMGCFPCMLFIDPLMLIAGYFTKSTSTDRASRRPVASSRIPRAWIQEGRGNPLWHIYSHSGRQCRPLTTNVPRGVRNPNNKGCRVHMSEWKSCTIRDSVFFFLQRQTCYRLPWWLVWIEGWHWSCSSSGHLWCCDYRQTHTTPAQTPANPTINA